MFDLARGQELNVLKHKWKFVFGKKLLFSVLKSLIRKGDLRSFFTSEMSEKKSKSTFQFIISVPNVILFLFFSNIYSEARVLKTSFFFQVRNNR